MTQRVPQLKAELFKALGNPVRIRILEQLSAAAEQSVSELRVRLGTEQSHLSQQLGILRRAGLVTSRREGTSVFYSLADPRVEELLKIARDLLLDTLATSQLELQS
ncbi:MAG: helix-turn-helix transcriptional regulator [Thermoleophilaceae bacterium]|nr:helix-turn-helix transcriptional regulator [Thermoleophilaceae bacterium]